MKLRILPILMIPLLAVSVLIGVSSTAYATNADKTIVMFIPNTDWPPYLIDDPKYPGGGVLVEVLRAVAEPMGYIVNAERLPNKRGWMLLNKGEVDVHAKAKEWVKRPDDYLWTDPFMFNEDVLLYRIGTDYSSAVLDDFYGKKIAAIGGFIYPALEKHFGKGRIERVDVASPYAMLELLALGRVDAALVNRSETQWLFRNRPDLHPERFRLDEKPCDSAGYRYVFTKQEDWQPFIDEFNKELEKMKQDGRLKAILDQYR